ncbi:glycosyltransferase family 4 protein [Flavobacteriales bacterium]|nr:glycosyltransferase family 4 protein [Flavobacteriales bacterium]
MHIIIYSGSANLNTLGATKSIDVMLVQYLKLNDCKLTWVGRGVLSDPPCTYYNLGKSNIGELLNRVYNKLRRIFFKTDIQDILLDEFIRFDNLMAAKIKSRQIVVDDKTLLIGRNGVSLNTFTEVKKRGGKNLLHSQWMHPYTQEKLLNKEFNKIGIIKKPIKEERIKRQVLETEIVDWIWCISKLVKDSYLSNGVNEGKLIDLSLGVDYDKYSAVSIKKYQSKKEFIILFVGNVNPEKGVHVLLEAINKSKLENIKIIFNGGLPDYFESIFNNHVQILKHRNISINVNPGDPLQNYRAASIFILPSVHESFGLVVLEAMAAGLPVIVSDMVGAKDCVKEGVNGYVFSSGNSDELSMMIKKLHSNKELVDKMGMNSAAIAENYDWSLIVAKLVNLINSSEIIKDE